MVYSDEAAIVPFAVLIVISIGADGVDGVI